MKGALLIVLGLVACGHHESASTTKGLANDGAGKNAAVIIGSPHNLPGVPTDVREFSKLLKKTDYDFRFTDVVSNASATSDEIFDMTSEAAKDADSFIWFFSGHGNTGVLLADDRTFTFHEVADVIREARDNKPLKRLIVFIDSCYSGSFVDGEEPIIESIAADVEIKCDPTLLPAPEESVFATLAGKDRGIFDEAFVLASSTKYESSVDLGSEQGGAFTWSMRGVVESFASSRRASTMGEFAAETSRQTKRVGGHTPVYRAFPEERILGEKLFSYPH